MAAGIARDHSRHDAQIRTVAGDPTELAARDQTALDSHPSRVAGGSTIVTQEVARDHRSVDAQTESVAGDPTIVTQEATRDHQVRDAPSTTVAGDPAVEVARDQERCDAQSTTVAGDPTVPLRLAADSLFDIEQLRIATENRIRSLGEIEGWEASPSAGRWQGYLESLHALETTMTKEMVQALRAHPLGPWVRRTVGIGEKQGGRLIALLGDPAWNYAEDRPRRGPAELWAYCGYVPGQRRRRGERANWSAEAKMRAFLCAEAALKAGVRKLDGCDDTDGYDLAHRTAITPYGGLYLDARAKHADAVHTEPCAQCGPAGHPAEVGSPLSLKHQHMRAVRVVAKAILRDLWREARRLHLERDQG